MKTLYETNTFIDDDCINEHALVESPRINMKGCDNGCPYNKYNAFVTKETSDKHKFPHFHIEDKANGMNYRFNPDGSFNSIKNKGNDKQSAKNALIKADKDLVKNNKFMNTIDMKDYITNLWYATND